MAEELRYIMVSNEDFLSGVQSYRRTHTDFLPAGDLDKWALGTGKSVDITMTVSGGSTKNQMTFKIEAQHVTEILVRFCIENNIPVPLAGIKDWFVRNDKIALRIFLNAEETTFAYSDLEVLA